jgi:RNA recognition motif-containing protein
MQKKLFVGGLSYNTDVEEIRELFVQAGEVISANIKDNSNQSRGLVLSKWQPKPRRRGH